MGLPKYETYLHTERFFLFITEKEKNEELFPCFAEERRGLRPRERGLEFRRRGTVLVFDRKYSVRVGLEARDCAGGRD